MYIYTYVYNRAAMVLMNNGIQENALTELQSTWGGTHDALLGMLLWVYAVPTFSLFRYGTYYRYFCGLCE